MHSAQVSGSVGPFVDPTTGQPVQGTVWGTVTFMAASDPSALAPQLSAAILRAVTSVVGRKLAAGQLAVPTIGMSLPALAPEIVTESSVASQGIQVQSLQLQAQIQSAAPAFAPQAAPLPPDPMQATANALHQAAQERLDPSNYEVRARINVGGFKIRASSDGGLDTDGLKAQAVDKAKSTLIWWAGGCVVALLVLLFLAGIGWYVWREARTSTSSGSRAPSGEAEKSSWDGQTPFRCGGSDNVKIEGVTATLSSGTAVSAGASCHLELLDVTINAPSGISAGANAVVTVRGGSVTGKQYAAQALGNAQIVFVGTRVAGPKKALGGGKITGP